MTEKNISKKQDVAKPVMPKVQHVHDQGYKEIYATGAMGGFDSQGAFHITFYMPELKPDTINQPPEKQIVEVKHMVKIILTPASMKQLTEWLNKNIVEFEKKFGQVSQLSKETYPWVRSQPPESMFG